MSQFFTNEAVSLEKDVDSVINDPTKLELIDATYEVQKCEDWIRSHSFKKVCLQFPDHLLSDSPEIALRLQKRLSQNVYILADTAYESCCIDYVAAAHIDADAIIHFGQVCFSKTAAKIPYLHIYEKETLNLESFHENVTLNFAQNQDVTILLDTDYIHMRDEITARFPSIPVKTVDSDELNLDTDSVLFVGGRIYQRKLPNLKFSYKVKHLYCYDEKRNPHLFSYERDEKLIRRRYFLIEKIKDSNTVGIVIGTLGVKNYLQAIERLKTLISLQKKKYYLISVGKPTVAKLANFPEIDIYVIVTCALNEIYDSRDYYKPIVTIYDVEMALNPESTQLEFTLDYNDVISRPIGEVDGDFSDVSLVTGKIRGGANVTVGSELVAKEAGTVALNTSYGAGFLAARSWKGLERDLERREVKMAEEGRRGIAEKYSDEGGDC